MRTDAYTKAVLTVIAACLVLLAVREYDGFSLVPFARAEEPAEMAGAEDEGAVDVRIVGAHFTYGDLVYKNVLPVEILGISGRLGIRSLAQTGPQTTEGQGDGDKPHHQLIV